MEGVYKTIEECNLRKKRKVLIGFVDMIVDNITNKRLNPIVIELFITGRTLYISIAFIRQSSFKVFKDIKVNFTHFLS